MLNMCVWLQWCTLVCGCSTGVDTSSRRPACVSGRMVGCVPSSQLPWWPDHGPCMDTALWCVLYVILTCANIISSAAVLLLSEIFYIVCLRHVLCACDAGFDSPLPYLYPLSLLFLLVHRASRDGRLCHQRFGSAWERYCQRVKYRIIPFIYWGFYSPTNYL